MSGGTRRRTMVPIARDPNPHHPTMPARTLDIPASIELIEVTPILRSAPNSRQESLLHNGKTKGRHKIYRTTNITEPLLGSESSSEEEINGDVNGVTELPSDDGVEITLVEKLPEPDEASWQIALQIFFPYIVAGLGMVAAGMLLDVVQHWRVYVEMNEFFILVPALLGLKGNLEMTLASRLSTQANLGNLESRSDQWKMLFGNLALIQVQAIVVGFLASVAAMIFGWIPKGVFNIHHGFILCASSVVTASLASLILGLIMAAVVMFSHRCNINPDNVATPIAASLGDITTLALLSGTASLLYLGLGLAHALVVAYTGRNVVFKFRTLLENGHKWLAPALIVLFLSLTPLWCFISHHNHFTHEVLYSGWTPVIGAMVISRYGLYSGWTPVIGAMVISSIGGLILDFTVVNYHGIAVFQPVINGVGGNLVAIQASRLSTSLHRMAKPGQLPKSALQGCPNVFSTYCGKGMGSRTNRILLLLVIPGHLIFMYVIHYQQVGHTSITLIFVLIYLTAAFIQVVLLLFVGHWMVHWMWKKGNDPDNFTIPYLTALGDLLGTALLACAFQLLFVIGDRDADVGD